MKYLLFVLLFSLIASASPDAQTRMGIANGKTIIGFTVELSWKLIAIKREMPKAIAAFQIANPADEGTPDSTNLGVSVHDKSSPESKSAIESLLAQRAEGSVEKKKEGDWDILQYSAKQGSTNYSVYDAIKPIANCLVMVRLAWPHLPKNPQNYDETMRKTFIELLHSIEEDKK